MVIPIFQRIRNSGLSVLIAGLLCNSVVFAEPAARAFNNLAHPKNTSPRISLSAGFSSTMPVPEIPLAEFKPETAPDAEKTFVVNESASFFEIAAYEKEGTIGIGSEYERDRASDNYFTISIPENIILSEYQVMLSYDLFGLATAESTTKSINGSMAYGGKMTERDPSWKNFSEYVPVSLLKNGRNELFFNRYTDSIYNYKVANVAFRFYNKDDASITRFIALFEASYLSEQDVASTVIDLSDENVYNQAFFDAFVKPLPESDISDHTKVKISGLAFKDVKPLDQDLVNVTSGDFPAYRLQVRDSIKNGFELFLAYDHRAIPEGYSPKDIRTYYYDKQNKSWKALPISQADPENRQMISVITDPGEGTDYINGIIKVPEQPETANFVPTTIKDMEFANPSAGVVSIPPPVANNTGALTTSFPLKLPPGRNGMQPSLEVSYNSEGGNGWMGMGWNVDIPAITVNTKWGVPRFDATKESELYSLSGQDLVFKSGSEFTSAHRNLDINRSSLDGHFYVRKEGSYLTVKRHGTGVTNYWWEVTDKMGNKSFYGGYSEIGISENHVLRKEQSPNSPIVHWALFRQQDPYGNFIEYTYDKPLQTLSNGISGWSYYIKDIKYTLHASDTSNITNYYQVDFNRSDERSDVITSARRGMMEITKDLLLSVDISLVENLRKSKIRTYRFDYDNGDFGKKHLSKISEYDSNNRLFYSNTLEYYQVSNKVISSTVETWSGDSDNVSSVLQNIATGNLASQIPLGSSLGTSVSDGFSVGFRAGIGVGLNPLSVANTIGGSYSYSSNKMDSKISFIDINGDGLPDKVYSKSSKVYYRPNTGNGFGNLILIEGLNRLDHNSSHTNGTGFDANLFGYISVGTSKSKTKSTTDHYFVDFNGDGLPDMVSNNLVRFNTTRANSDPSWRSFTSDANATSNPIVSGTIDPGIIGDMHFETLEELRTNHPQFDHVKVWRAPYTGTIRIGDSAHLILSHACENPDEANKFKIWIEHARGQEVQRIFNQTLTANTTAQIPTKQVEKGDFLFFRVHNERYGCGGEVSWNPVITYLSGAPSEKDENHKSIQIYDSKEDFILNNGGGWQPEGDDNQVTIRLNLDDANFAPLQFSDDIDFIVEKIATDNTTGESEIVDSWTQKRTLDHLTGNFTSESAPNSIFTSLAPVGDTKFSLNFYARSDSNVSWDELNWRPEIAGSQGLYYPGVTYRTYDDNVTQAAFWIKSSELPNIRNIAPGEETDPIVKISHNLMDMRSSSMPLILNIVLNQMNSSGELPLAVNWSVKEKRNNVTKTIHKRTLYLIRYNGSFVFSKSPSTYISLNDLDKEYKLTREYIRDLRQDQGVLYSAFYVENRKVTIFDNTEITIASLPDVSPIMPVKTIKTPFIGFSPEFFGFSHRKWGAFLYNGLLEDPIVPDVFIIDESQINPDAIQDQIDDIDPDSIDPDAELPPYTLYILNNELKQYENDAIIDSRYGINQTGALTATLSRFGEKNLYNLYVDPESIYNNNGLVVGLKQRSESNGRAKSYELVGAQYTDSESHTKILNQYVDINGDRYPDIVTEGKIQYTRMDGSLSPDILSNTFITSSKNTDETAGATIASMKINSDPKNPSKNPIISNVSAGINGGNGNTSEVYQWIDMNGDGLPDKVLIENRSIKVWLNTGYSFSNEIIWGQSSVDLITSIRQNVGIGVPFSSSSFAAGLGGGTSTANIQTTLQDINGDGLPDLVINNNGDYLYYVNNGIGFQMNNVFLLGDNISTIERDFSISGNIYGAATFGFVIPIVLVKFTFSPSLGANASFSEKPYAFQDIDGDGLPDLLYKQDGNGSVQARLNQSGKAHLLKKVNTPLGGSWEVDYVRIGNTYDMPQSKWVMREVKTFDGFTGDNEFAPDESLTRFTYENGRHDRRERDFYGFESVRTDQCIPDSGEILRYTVQRFHNNNYYLAGKPKETIAYNKDGEKLSQQRYFYNIRKPDNEFVSEMNTSLETPFVESDIGNLDVIRVVTPLVKTIATQYEEGGNLNSVSENLGYDEYGNITKFRDPGTGANDAYVASIAYSSDFRALPEEITISAQGAGELRKRTATYNDFGKLKEVKTTLNDTDENSVKMKYDNYGNLIEIIQEDNKSLNNTESFVVTLKYDGKIHTYPVEVKDSYGQISRSVYDYLHGVPVLQTDSNGNSIRIRIDQRGRDIEIAGPYEYNPGQSDGNDWIIRKQYPGELPVAQQTSGSSPTDYLVSHAEGKFEAIAPGDDDPTTAEHFARTLHKDPLNIGNEFQTLSIVDGFGQAIQLKKTHYANGSLVWQLSGKEKKDDLGRVIEQYLPTIQNFSAGSTAYVREGTGGQAVIMNYDDKDRQTLLRQPGETTAATISYSVEDAMLKTEVTNENGQTQATFTDVRGRTRKTVQNEALTTHFFYNAVNEQIKVRDHSGNETHYFYDMAGRRIKEQHPDRGTTQYTYDNAGRLTGKETANALEQGSNHAITYSYDFGRLMEIKYPDHPQNNVSYEYGRISMAEEGDYHNIGRLISQKDATGVQYFNYGKLGELVQQKRGVAVAGKTFYWFETNWEYDSWARIKKITYPDEEEITYHYDPAGQLRAITTNLNSLVNVSAPEYIVRNITYTDYGERASITYGNGTINTYNYDTRRRLNTLQHDFANFNMTRNYEYDPLSNITRISSTGATSPTLGALGGPVEHRYKYDGYNRLGYAEGYYIGPDDEVPDMLKQAYSLEMEYDLSHNILEKNQIHQFGSVSSIGEQLPMEARHATATSYKLEYSGYGSGTFAHQQPHAPRKITEYPQEDYDGDPDDPRIKRKHIAYDANGNQLEIKEEEKDPGSTQGYRLRSVRKNLWDAEDRLTAVDLEPEAEPKKPLIAVYTYDAGGERTIKYVPARVDARYSAKDVGSADRFESILYPSALLTAKTITFPEITGQEKDPRIMTYTKHYYIGSERIASVLGTKRGMGAYCATERAAVRDELNDKVTVAGEAIEEVFHHFGKHIQLPPPFVYSDSNAYPCSSTQVPEDYGAYWYHPDHLGSSSYITNLDGEIAQHMEYLPFGETLVEEHLNSNNSPYKFNAKEFDAETGNYCYGARYYDPKWSIWLSVDPLFVKYPTLSPYIYVAHNPIINIDPDGKQIIPVHGTWSNPNTWQNLKGIAEASLKLFGDNNLGKSFQWSGANYSIYRTNAALNLIGHILESRKNTDPSEPVTLVGHSHGGNVSIEAINIMMKMEEFADVQINLLTINTPVRNDYQLSEEASQRVNHVNIYDPKDPVQIGGGNTLTVMPVPNDKKGTGELGPAKRKFKNARNIEVDNPQNIFSDYHNSHNRIEDWIHKIENKQ